MKHESNERDSLNWLAFRYVAGELSADEQASFESRLDTEQAAREAVAHEVELAQAVAIAAASPVSPATVGDTAPRQRSSQHVGWLALAASLVIGFFLGRSFLAVGPNEMAKLSPAESAAQELAGYWQAGEPAEAEPVVEETSLAAAEIPDVDDAEEGAVPSWLLAALEPEEAADAPREN